MTSPSTHCKNCKTVFANSKSLQRHKTTCKAVQRVKGKDSTDSKEIRAIRSVGKSLNGSDPQSDVRLPASSGSMILKNRTEVDVNLCRLRSFSNADSAGILNGDGPESQRP